MLLKRYFLYLIRWQLSTPILAFCVIWFAAFGTTWSTVIANLVGGIIFFWIDRFIFTSDKLGPVWSVREHVVCADCGTVARGYRLVFAGNYDRRKDPHPEFRCEICSRKKTEQLKQCGVNVE
jgi:hypothetical protein